MKTTDDANGETLEFYVNKDILNSLSEDDQKVYQQIKRRYDDVRVGLPPSGI